MTFDHWLRHHARVADHNSITMRAKRSLISSHKEIASRRELQMALLEMGFEGKRVPEWLWAEYRACVKRHASL